MFVKNKILSFSSATFTAAGIATLFYKKQARDQSDLSEAQSEFKPPFFRAAVHNSPKFDKRSKGGEDAWLISSDSKMIVACDGVGGWGELDVDPGKFSKFLCTKMSELYNEKIKNSETPTPTTGKQSLMMQILDEGVEKNPNMGSTTAVMARLNGKQGEMETCNLGDSGYLWMRPNQRHSFGLQTMYRSMSQQYSFNFPYQCGTYCQVPSTEADTLCHTDLKHNDIVVMGTDGLFDNLYDHQIKHCFKMDSNRGDLTMRNFTDKELKEAVECIGVWAEFQSYQKEYVSPFTQGAIEAGRDKKKDMGGKKDDITVIVAQIKLQ